MPIRIDTAMAWGQTRPSGNGLSTYTACYSATGEDPRKQGFFRVRIVRETDYRKLMALVRAAEAESACSTAETLYDLQEALDALRKKK
jgi:hypothetical protein